MKTVKILRITADETEELKKENEMEHLRFKHLKGLSKDELKELNILSPQEPKSFKNLLELSENQTHLVLSQVKNIHEWKDVELMVDFVAVFKKIKTAKKNTINLEDSEVKTVVEVMDAAGKSGKITGLGLEKFVEVYSDFKNAEQIKNG